MAMKIYFGVGDKAHNIRNLYIGINGKAHKVKKAYKGVDGKARLFWSSGIPATVSGSGNVNKCYALSDGVKYYTNGDAFEAQTSINFTVAGGGQARYKGSVTINGGEVLIVTSESAQSYSWTIPNNVNSITIAMTYNQSRGNGTITVTTT